MKHKEAEMAAAEVILLLLNLFLGTKRKQKDEPQITTTSVKKVRILEQLFIKTTFLVFDYVFL